VQAIGKNRSSAEVSSAGFRRNFDIIPVKAGAASAVLVLFLLCSCRQLQTNTVSSSSDGSVAASPTLHDTRPTTVYRIAADDQYEGVAATDDRPSSDDCRILRPREPDQFLRRNNVEPEATLSEFGTAGGPLGDFAAGTAAPAFDIGEIPSLPVDEGTSGLPPASEYPNGEPQDGGFTARFRGILASTLDEVWHDYDNYYSRPTAVQFTAILAPAAVLANTNLDANFAHWYQTNVRSRETNHAADFFRPLGDGYYTIPVYVSAKFVGEYFDDVPGMELLGEFGDRATRALMVGAPPLLAVQYVLGAGRPNENIDQSYWKPFHSSHGASGHAFMGAIPFLTLAGMTDDPWAKCFFYACSPWTGVSRINDNVHYLSQVWLGWWMAFLACESVNKTESQKGPIQLEPLVTPEITGVGLIYQH